MKVIFLHGDGAREKAIATSFIAGVQKLGVDADVRPVHEQVDDASVVCLCGVDAVALGMPAAELFAKFAARSQQAIYFDKGYVRHTTSIGGRAINKFWRVSVNSNQPTAYLGAMSSQGDRWKALRLPVRPWRRKGNRILFTGGSDNYHRFGALSDPTKYAHDVIAEIRKRSPRPIIYRPKPSWKAAVPIDGTEFSRKPRTIEQELRRSRVMVTHGSNGVFEAVLAGVPSIVLGDGVGSLISSTSLDDLEQPKLATEREKMQWLHNLSYCQFTLPEMAMGLAWREVSKHLHG